MISLPWTTRSLFLMNLGSLASSGRPSTSPVRANWPSLPTTSINSPSVQRNTPAGMPPLPQVPRRGLAVDEEDLRVVRQRGDDGVEQADVDMLPLPAIGLAVIERGQDADR